MGSDSAGRPPVAQLRALVAVLRLQKSIHRPIAVFAPTEVLDAMVELAQNSDESASRQRQKNALKRATDRGWLERGPLGYAITDVGRASVEEWDDVVEGLGLVD